MSSILIIIAFIGSQSPLVTLAKPAGSKPATVKPAAAKKTTPAKAAAGKSKSAATKPATAKKTSAPAKKRIVAAKPAHKAHPGATIALKESQPSSRVISGKLNRSKTASPVHLAQVPATPKAITPKAADKRKLRNAATRQTKTVQYPPIGIYQIHLREFASIRVYDENGYLRPQALTEFNKINRCVRTGVVLPMDYRLLVELYDAWIAFGMPSITLFSGCRQVPDATPGSRHNFGTAIDYNFDGVSRRELIAWLLSRRDRKVHGMGVGYYPNAYHIHMDVREKHAFWVDLNPAGEKGSMMVADSYRWFANERKLRTRTAEVTPKEAPTQETAEVTPKEETPTPPAP